MTLANPGRRRMLTTGLGAALAWTAQGLVPAWARSGARLPETARETLSGHDIRLTVGRSDFTVGGRSGHAVTVNGGLPAPLIRLQEGQSARLSVTNSLNEDTSIHWHGLLLPFQMDGVPGVSFPGIGPGETFVYEFPVRQAGTYWYHSHSNLQEAMGLYGPLIIDPATPDAQPYDREHILVLSDWSFLHPHDILDRLKKSPGYFNRQRTTLAGLISGRDGVSLADRRLWGAMRMEPRDVSDVGAAAYTYLVNGHGPDENWTGLFQPGERVRLRIINAAAMSIFNFRIPGLPMTVIQADGKDVRPVEVDEFQIAVAETYDVIVTPSSDRAFTIFAEALDRSGAARATLAPRLGMSAPIPELRPPVTLSMRDMGMGDGHAGMNHGAPSPASQPPRPAETVDHAAMDHAAMGHGPMTPPPPSGLTPQTPAHAASAMRDVRNAPPGMATGVGVDMIAPAPVDRMGDRPLGLETAPHRVLVYTDLVALRSNPRASEPTRALTIHLTGNMERFMWGFDGRKFSEIVDPIRFGLNERVRVTLVNDTMMSHPIHLHGHFFELVTGATADRQPLKHTVNVMPGGKAVFDLTADAPGDWAFHCHMLMHMHAGMFNVVTVRPVETAAS